jgi:hypothetical protein
VAGEADFGEETHGFSQDLLLAIRRGEALAALAIGRVMPRGSAAVTAFARSPAVATARPGMVWAGYRPLPCVGMIGSST